MASKGAKSPFNVCYVSTPSSKTDKDGNVTAGPDQNYFFQTSRIYEEVEVGKRCGITYVDPDKWEGQEPLVTVAQLVLSGKLARLTGESSGDKGLKSVSFLAARNKVGDLLSDDKAKNLDGLNHENNKGETVGKFFKVRTATRDSYS